MFFRGFPALFRPFWPGKFPIAPNQHRPPPDLRWKPGNTAPPPFPQCAFPHPLQNRVPRGPAAQWAASRPDRAGRRDKSFCPIARLSHPFSPVLNRSHPLQHPKRTRFCLFSAFPGAFLCFLPFWTCKILGPVFVHCADMPHRLKPSVIPCRREVSFLT